MGMNAASFGLDAVDGEPANKDAIKNATIRNVDLYKHKTTSVKTFNFRESDLLLFMTPMQIKRFNRLHSCKYQCTLLGLWTNDNFPILNDPYGKPDMFFNDVFKKIDNATKELLSITTDKNS